MEEWRFRKAAQEDGAKIWDIFENAILKRKLEGSDQWQDGYPNINVIESDIERGTGFVAVDKDENIAGYIAVIFEIEPAYEILEGTWLSNETYTTVHRIAVSQQTPIKGLGTWLLKMAESVSIENGVWSMRADTNFDNYAMLRVFEKLGYQYCGTVYFRGGARRAFEKLLK